MIFLTRYKFWLFGLSGLIIGLVIGGFLFSKPQPRSFLAITNCQNICYKANDLAGLLASAGVSQAPGAVPFVVKETDKTIALKYPSGRRHWVIVPKRDIKNVGDISADDQAYLIDAYAVIGDLIRENNVQTYRLYTNGPGLQTVTYLHFHLIEY